MSIAMAGSGMNPGILWTQMSVLEFLGNGIVMVNYRSNMSGVLLAILSSQGLQVRTEDGEEAYAGGEKEGK